MRSPFRGRRLHIDSHDLAPFQTARLIKTKRLLSCGIAGAISLFVTVALVIVSIDIRHMICRSFAHPPLIQAIRFKIFHIDPIPKGAIMFREDFLFEEEDIVNKRSEEFMYNATENNTNSTDSNPDNKNEENDNNSIFNEQTDEGQPKFKTKSEMIQDNVLKSATITRTATDDLLSSIAGQTPTVIESAGSNSRFGI